MNNNFIQLKTLANSLKMELFHNTESNKYCIRHMLFESDGNRMVRFYPDASEFNKTESEVNQELNLLMVTIVGEL